jgi:hypothetical protein
MAMRLIEKEDRRIFLLCQWLQMDNNRKEERDEKGTSKDKFVIIKFVIIIYTRGMHECAKGVIDTALMFGHGI